jgi:hypothetical protein
MKLVVVRAVLDGGAAISAETRKPLVGKECTAVIAARLFAPADLAQDRLFLFHGMRPETA